LEGGECCRPVTCNELSTLDVRRGSDLSGSMEWYRAMRARYRGEMTTEDVDQAEGRGRALVVELRRAFSERN